MVAAFYNLPFAPNKGPARGPTRGPGGMHAMIDQALIPDGVHNLFTLIEELRLHPVRAAVIFV